MNFLQFKDLLKKYWNHNDFRDGQAKIIQKMCTEEDILAVMPTGRGKSICFQLPALAQEGYYLVITPLIALMEDQVSTLNQKKIPALGIHSHSPLSLDMEQQLRKKALKLLYVAPESLAKPNFLRLLQKNPPRRIVLDEAHCISTWGNDFRPSYRKVGTILKKIPPIPIFACTATATPQVIDDIIHTLKMQSPQKFIYSCRKNNIAIHIQKVWNKEVALLQSSFLSRGMTIIYCRSRQYSVDLADLLCQKGFIATCYHAGLSNEEKKDKQTLWTTEKIKIMVATTAFGMGIDKSNVRLILHMYIPESLEDYMQAIGRAGRDQKDAHAILYYEAGEVTQFLQNVMKKQVDKKVVLHVYACLKDYWKRSPEGLHTTSIPFDLLHFCYRYQLTKEVVQKSLRYLKEADIIMYEEAFYQPAQVKINCLPNALYRLKVHYPTHLNLLRKLLDLHHAKIFQQPCPFSLANLTETLSQSEKCIENQLKELAIKKIITYTPSQKLASIKCVQTTQLHIRKLKNSSIIQKNQASHQYKSQSVVSFLRANHRCRMLMLQDYFGESSYTDCKKCDFCKLQTKNFLC